MLQLSIIYVKMLLLTVNIGGAQKVMFLFTRSTYFRVISSNMEPGAKPKLAHA